MSKQSTPPSRPIAATAAELTSTSSSSRREWRVLLVICLLGLGLRLWRFDKLSIEHFDEGVYAGNIYAVLDQNCYPQRHLYAPPLFPMLCEFAIGIGGTPDAAIWVNLLLGTLTVPLVWCVARDRFGLAAAIVSSMLCATSDYHIFFSRSALTDVSLGFWLLLAVWLASRGMQSGHKLTLAGAAIAASLAWWSKYNGWLAIAIPLGGWGLLGGVSFLKAPAAQQTRWSGFDRTTLFRWGLFAVLTGLLWYPMINDLQAVGGYATVSANHSRYLVGIWGWWNGFRMHVAFHSWLTTLAGVSGFVLAATVLLRGEGRSATTSAIALALLAAIATIIGVGGTLGITAVLAIDWLVNEWFATADSRHQERRLFEAMLMTWWVGLTLTTPLYTPYARLSLPWLISSWLLVGVLFDRLSRVRPSKRDLSLGAGCLVVLALLLLGQVGRPKTHVGTFNLANTPVWADRTSLRKATPQLLHECDMGRQSMPPSESAHCEYAIYVAGEPALFCHLTQQSAATVVTKPAANVAEVAVPLRAGPAFPKFIITGGHTPASEIEQATSAGHIEQIYEQQVLVSDMVALDSASLEQLMSPSPNSTRLPGNTMTLRVFRIKE
ncbi:MAG: glycosyltransferase family 39 protein [Planctomycetaceae bacterium]